MPLFGGSPPESDPKRLAGSSNMRQKLLFRRSRLSITKSCKVTVEIAPTTSSVIVAIFRAVRARSSYLVNLS